MPLSIGLADRKAMHPYPSTALSFNDDGYYWFCYPHFDELARRTGEMIDLYDGAWFFASALDDLYETLSAITAKARTMPEEWDECVGNSMGSQLVPTPPTPVYSKVNHSRLLALLSKFAEIVVTAKRDGNWIACLGD